MASDYNNYRYAYLRTRNELLRVGKELREKEERERKAREAQFPQSIAQYAALNDPAAKTRIARFLVADKATQERMLTQFGWAWRQVQPLVGDFASNVSSRRERMRRRPF